MITLKPSRSITHAKRDEELQYAEEQIDAYLAEHYGTVVIPARIKKPRDKAKVEVGVQIAERQTLAALRDQRFFNVGN